MRTGARWLVLSLPLSLALVFCSAFSAPFATPKNAVFALTVLLLAALVLICSSGWKQGRDARRFSIAVGAYLALNVVSALVSQNRSICVESVEFAVCGVLLFAASRVALGGASKGQNTRHLQIAMTAAAVLVSVVALAQFQGVNLPGGLGAYAGSGDRMRIYATLGNPDFVAAFLAVALPAAMGLGIAAGRLRALWISASVLIGVAILLTGSRGGVIALAAGVAVIAAAGMRGSGRSRGAVLAAVAVACALAAGTHLNSRTPLESLRGRMLIWQVSLGEGAARSAMGSGPGSLAYEYPARLGRFFAEPGREALLRFASHERHAQNDYVEAWHDTGWLGLGSLLMLLGWWFGVAVRRLRACEDEARPGVAAAIAAVSALCAASLFDFPMHRAETWALFWIWMAVPLMELDVSPVPERAMAWARYAGAGLLLVAGSYFAFAPLAASYETGKGESEESSGRLESSRAADCAALRWEPWQADANFNLVRVLAKMGDYRGALEQAGVAAQYVNEPELYILRSRILEKAGRSGEARGEIEAGVRAFPYSVELRDELASHMTRGTESAGR